MIGTSTYSFGEWIKQRRAQLRMTQREVALTVHCSPAMIKKVEADERHPSPELAALLAGALKIPEIDREIFVEAARGERAVDGLWHVARDIGDIGDNPAPPRALHTPGFLPSSLPSAATPFVGRADELSEIGERLAHSDCRLLTLTGPGGAGKTRLALAAAQTQAAFFRDGMTFVALAAVREPQAIPEAIARSLRLTLSGPPGEQIIAFLRRRSMLLILDNCEQLDGDLSWLSALGAQAPGLKLLATTRERLHLAEEWVYAVPGLAQAETLFVTTAQRITQNFDAEAERPAIVRICRLVERLPLAVELAASWTPLLTCAEIAEHIQRDINILTADVRNIEERHRSIQAVCDQSWNLLTREERHALMRLAVFRGGWQAKEALVVAETDLVLLRRLLDKSLVRVEENERYDLHELIRQYATQKLGQAGLEAETRRRHFDAYHALAAQLHVQQFGAGAKAALARFDQEHDNIRAALGWALDTGQVDTGQVDTGQAEAGPAMLYHLWFYWSRRGYYREAGEWAMRAIQRGGDVESVYLCIALSSAAAFSYIQGRFGEGEVLARRTVAMAQRLEDPEALIAAYGTYTFASMNVDQALCGLQEGIALIHATGKMRESLPLFYLGAATWLHSNGRYAEAKEYYRKSIALFRQMGAVDMLADPLGRLGQLALQEGRLQEAHELTVASIAAARAVGADAVFGAWGGARLGLIELYLGDTDAAQRHLAEALLLFGDGRDARAKQEALAIASEVALASGDVTNAVEQLQASLEICRTLFRQLQATQTLAGSADALPIDLIGLCARAAMVAAAQGQHGRAVMLGSIADFLQAQSGQVILPPLQARLTELMAAIRVRLAASTFEAAWDAGQQMSLEEAFAFLLM